MSKAKLPDTITRKAERQRRQAEQERREKRKSRWMLVTVILLMVGGLLADVLFIGWQKHQRRLRHNNQHERLTNHPADSNPPRLEAPALFVATNFPTKIP